MKRTRFLTCLVGTIILIGASIGCYNKLACYAIYEIHKGEWIEVYRSIDSERAHTSIGSCVTTIQKRRSIFT